MSISDQQARGPAAADATAQPLPNSDTLERLGCWNEIGVHGDGRCRELPTFIHCRNCPVYASAGARLLDRPLPPEYRREWTEHFAKEKPPVAPGRTSAVLFRVSAEWLALPTEAFQQVAERRLVHSLPPRQHGIVLGLVNIRGELLICVSLDRLLGLQDFPAHTAAATPTQRLLVAEWHGNRFVFPVAEISGIHRFDAPELKQPPATSAKANLSCIRGVLHWQERTVGLLDVDLLFSVLNRNLT